MRARTTCLIVGCAMLLCAGCGRKGADVQTYPVSGEVFRGGKPAPSGTVQFVHQTDSAIRAVGEIDSGGKFTLFTLVGDEKRDGAVAGEYRAVLVFGARDPAFQPKTVFKVEPRTNTFKIAIP